MFGVKEVSENDLYMERNLLLSRLPLENQRHALDVWDNAYHRYRKECMDRGIYCFEMEGKFRANAELRHYIRKLK